MGPQRTRCALAVSASRAGFALAFFAACSACTPSIFDLSPQEAQRLRAPLGRIGVRSESGGAEITFRQPAKGVLGGAGRGAVVGAVLPIAIGAVIPLPGTTFLGALAAPFTAAVGMIYGAIVAPPRAEVNSAEAAIDRAVATLRETQPRRRLQDSIVQQGRARTGRLFVALDDTGGDEVDAVLDLTDQRAGLEGAWRVNPPLIAFAETRVRLQTTSGETLLEETIFCSGEERSYSEWAATDASLFAAAMNLCVEALAEKVVDDFFLIYPSPSRRID